MPTLLTPNGKRQGGIRANYSRGFVSREEDWHFQVRADSLLQSRTEILFSTPNLPIIGATILNGMLCVGGDATRTEEHGLVWDVAMTFTNSIDEDDQQNSNQGGDPTVWVPVRRTMWETKEEIMTKDASGNRICNSAGIPFDTGIRRRRHLPAWEFTQWEPISVTDDDILGRNEVTNSGTWPPINGKPAKTWLCKVVDSVVGFYFGYRCRMTTYRLVYDKKKWTQKRLDVGTSYKSGSDLIPYLDKSGNVILGALNGSGGKQSVGTAPAELEFDEFDAVSFSFLRIR